MSQTPQVQGNGRSATTPTTPPPKAARDDADGHTDDRDSQPQGSPRPQPWSSRRLGAVALIVGMALIFLAAVAEPAPEGATGTGAPREGGPPWSAIVLSAGRRIATDVGVALLVFGALTFTFEDRAHKQMTMQVDHAIKRVGTTTAGSIHESIHSLNDTVILEVGKAITTAGRSILGETLYPVFDELRTELKFARRDVVFDLQIGDAFTFEGERYVWLDYTYSYYVTNESGGPLEYEASIEDDVPPEPRLADKVGQATFTWGGEPLAHDSGNDEAGWAMTWRGKAEMDTRQEKQFIATWGSAGRLQDSYTFFMNYMSTGITITVRHHKDFEVHATMLHFTKTLRADFNNGKDREGTDLYRTCTWTMAGTCFPGQAFVVKWRPAKNAQRAQHAVASANPQFERL
jgi:hypothetical protein